MRHINKMLCLVAVGLFCSFASAFGAPKFGQLPNIHVDGKYLKDECGNIVRLHGVMDTPSAWFNNGRWGWVNYAFNGGKFNDNDCRAAVNYFIKIFEAITDTAQGAYCNIFRLHLEPAWTSPGSKGENDISTFSMDRFKAAWRQVYQPIAEEALKHGLYVILRPPGVCPEQISVGDAYQNYLKQVWGYVAQQEFVQKNAGTVSIELANEPVRLNGGCSNYFQPIFDQIRNNGFTGIIWVPGTGYQSNYTEYTTSPMKGTNYGFAVHVYSGWYGMSDESVQRGANGQTFITNFAKQVPVANTHPIVVTECDWSPGHVVGTNFDGSLKSENLGTWATAKTSLWGNAFKACMDHYGLSLTLTSTDVYVDMETYLASGKVQCAFTGKDGYQEASGYTCFKWYKDYAHEYPSYLPNCESGNGGGSGSGFFPLGNGDVKNLHGDNVYDATARSLSFTEYGCGGWKYASGADMSAYDYLIVKLKSSSTEDVEFHFVDGTNYYSSDNECRIPIGTELNSVIDLKSLKTGSGDALNLSHIYYAGFWSKAEGDIIEIDTLYLAKACTGIEFAYPRLALVPYGKQGMNVFAVYSDGKKVDVTADCQLSIMSNEIELKADTIYSTTDSGEGTISAMYVDALGIEHTVEAEIDTKFFPLYGGGLNPNIWEKGTFDETTGVLHTGQWGFGGWYYSQGIDLSDYDAIVAELSATQNTSASFRVFGTDSYWSEPCAIDFGTGTKVEINLQKMTDKDGNKIDPATIYYVGVWTSGSGDVAIKEVYLMKDGLKAGIEEAVAVEREIAEQVYISPLGTISATPFEGVNIVRTTYTNGDIQFTKAVLNK